MAGEGGEPPQDSPPTGFAAKIGHEWRKIREHAEAYPYVWASYILVYGCIGVYVTYRWHKLRRTEDRVRALQERLRQLVEEEQSAATTAASSPPELDASRASSVQPPPTLDQTSRPSEK